MPSRRATSAQACSRHRLRAQLGQPAGAVALEARVDRGGDREAQDDVSQEREPLVGVGAAVDPGGVRERLLREIFGELIEERWRGCPALRVRQDAFCGRVGGDLLGRLADGQEPGGLVVGDLDAVGVLELHRRARPGGASRRRRSSLKRVSSWIRAGSISSSALRWARMRSMTSSLVIWSAEASSGCGPQDARGLQCRGGALDHALVECPLRQPDGVGDPLGARAAVGDHRDAAQARAGSRRRSCSGRARRAARPTPARISRPPTRRHRRRLDRVADRADDGLRRPLDRLERDVAGEAVGDDDVERRRPSGRCPRRCRRS